MADQARLLIEVSAGVMPPEIQMVAPCGSADPAHIADGPHEVEGSPGEVCFGLGTMPTGWEKPRLDAHQQVFGLTSREWQGPDAPGALKRVVDQALAHAAELMAQPGRFNHVRVDWIWL